MTRTALALCLLSILALALAIPAAFAETGGEEPAAEEEKAEPKLSPLVKATGGKDDSSETKVFTNDDLKNLQGSGPASSPSRPATTAPDGQAAGQPAPAGAEADPNAAPPKTALDQMFEKEAARQEHEKKIAEAEKRVVDAKQRVVDLEKRQLAVKNPLLARPSAPEEGTEEWNAGNGQDRVAMIESQMQVARDEVTAAESELAALRAGRP